MKYSERVPAGDATEAQVARMLEAKGHKVVRPPRRDGAWDLMVDGRSVDVKGGVKTTSRGSDGNPIVGYVFANLHPDPKVEFYLLACLGKRREVLTYYFIPSSMAKQQTLTLTRAKARELEMYRENLSPLRMRKSAARILYEEGRDLAFARHLRVIESQSSYNEPLVDHAGRIGAAFMVGGSNRLYEYAQGQREMTARAGAGILFGAATGRFVGKFLTRKGN